MMTPVRRRPISQGRDSEYRIEDYSGTRIGSGFRMWHPVTIRTGATALARGPWVSVILAVVSVLLWSAAYGNLLVWAGPFTLIVILGAGPLAAAGIVMGIRNLVRHRRPRWVSIAGIILGLTAVAYIGTEFLHILAIVTFA
jgi:hypothetical protein